ncbi:MAG: methylmalonyl-CoA mutase family protein [Nitrospirota bacterium]
MGKRKDIEKIKKAKDRWTNEMLRPNLKLLPERLPSFTTVSNLSIDEPLYTPSDAADLDYLKDLGFPGEYPFTRGTYPSMYRGRIWTMREFAGYGTAEETNKRFKYLLKKGTTGLSVAFDLPTLMGYDSDHPRAKGEVGRCGVAIDSLSDMERLFKGIPLDKITTSMTINAPAAVIFAMYIAVAEKQGVSPSQIGGTIQNDILKEYIAQKEWIYPPLPSIKLITDTISYCVKNAPKWHPISISGYHIREAGATAVQELAFTLVDGLTYVDACIKAGLKIDEFAGRLSFFFNSHNDFFEEIAKFRAARRIWAREIKERYRPKDFHSMQMRFHIQTAGCSLTAQQPYNNIVRTAIQALAAVLGGTQSLHTNSMDETLSLPTERAVTIALRTQQIIAYESGVTNTIDPLGGAYFIEALTNKVEEEVYKYFKKIDELGGMVEAIQQGFPQREIARSAQWYQRAIEKKDKIVVGLNEFIEEEEPIETLRIGPEVEKRQIKAVKEIRKKRSRKKWEASLRKLRIAAEGKNNLMPYIIDAVKAYATVGEVSNTLKEVFGEYKEPAAF